MDIIYLLSEEFLKSAKQAIMITGFVFVMMLVIEYINVLTKGLWSKSLLEKGWKQYVFAALLGVIPGCLGAFTAVSLFSHGMISFGAIVATMIATSGDEAFVMFAQMPGKALLISGIILIVGILAGFITDRLFDSKKLISKFSHHSFPLHKEDKCRCFQKELFFDNLIKTSAYRLILIISVLFLLIAVSYGLIAGNALVWIRVTLILVISFSLFIVISVPEHFLREHLWDHVVKKHLLSIFLWTLGALLTFNILLNYIDISGLISDNMLIILLVVIIIGIIPESGPHLIFVTLFIEGIIPISVLLASSIVQDGHGMLPLLAESKRSFLAVKAVNVVFAMMVGLTGYFIGF